jgi:4-hydroxybenzoate decarboxylase
MRRFLEDLARLGELATVRRAVDPRHQLAAVTKAVQKTGDKAVLFEVVEGTNFPVVSNLYGSHERLCRLVGARDETFCQRWIALTDACLAGRDADVLERAPDAVEAEFVSGTLSDLPAITYHGRDAGPYFTSAIFLAREPDSGVPNLSFHRSMYVSDDELRVRPAPRTTLPATRPRRSSAVRHWRRRCCCPARRKSSSPPAPRCLTRPPNW